MGHACSHHLHDRAAQLPAAVSHLTLANLPCSLASHCRLLRDCLASTHARARAASRPWLARLTCALFSSPCAQSRQAKVGVSIEDTGQQLPLQEARRVPSQADLVVARGHGWRTVEVDGIAPCRSLRYSSTVFESRAAMAPQCCGCRCEWSRLACRRVGQRAAEADIVACTRAELVRHV